MIDNGMLLRERPVRMCVCPHCGTEWEISRARGMDGDVRMKYECAFYCTEENPFREDCCMVCVADNISDAGMEEFFETDAVLIPAFMRRMFHNNQLDASDPELEDEYEALKLNDPEYLMEMMREYITLPGIEEMLVDWRFGL